MSNRRKSGVTLEANSEVVSGWASQPIAFKCKVKAKFEFDIHMKWRRGVVDIIKPIIAYQSDC